MNVVLFFYLDILLVFVAIVGLIFGFNSIAFYFIFAIIALVTLLLGVYMVYFTYCLIKENKLFVPYVPTPMYVVREMINLAGVKEGDNVYDMGCGDGRLVTSASKIKNTKCVGIEWKFDVALTGIIRNFFMRGSASIKRGDMYKEDISDANVIFTYLLPHAMDKLETKIIQECDDSVVVVSHGFVFKNLKLQEERKVGKLVIRRYSKI